MTGGSVEVLTLHTTRRGGERVRKLIAASPFVRQVGSLSGLSEFETRAVQLRPSLMLMEFDAENQELADTMARLRSALPASAMIVTAEATSPEHIVKAMRLGAREYLIDDEASVQAFTEAVVRLGTPASEGGRNVGRLIAVMGAKGGVGASFLAANLAWAMSQIHGQRVALVDLDLYGGNQSFLLDLDPSRSWADVAREFDRLDDVFLDGLMLEAGPGFRLLAAPDDAVEAEEIRAEHAASVLDSLMADNPVVVVDLPSWLSDASLAVLDRATRVLLVTEPNVLGLRAAKRILELCERLGHAEDKIRPVANRADSKLSVRQAKMEAVLGRPVAAWLPNEFKALTEAGNSGRPVLAVAPKCRWSKAVIELAADLIGPEGEDE